MQNCKKSVSASNFALTGKMLQKLAKYGKLFLDSRQLEDHQFFTGFPDSKMMWLLLKKVNTH